MAGEQAYTCPVWVDQPGSPGQEDLGRKPGFWLSLQTIDR